MWMHAEPKIALKSSVTVFHYFRYVSYMGLTFQRLLSYLMKRYWITI